MKAFYAVHTANLVINAALEISALDHHPGQMNTCLAWDYWIFYDLECCAFNELLR